MTMNRKTFLAASGALLATGKAFGAKISLALGGKKAPNLTFGVLADIHINEPATTETFEHALRHFDAVKADAVMICGDMADYGLLDQLQNVADAWFRVFPENKRSDGQPIEKLFIYGDHDTGLNVKLYDKIFAKPGAGDRKARAIPEADRAAIWERVFKEKYEPIFFKDVKGYKFVLYNFINGPTSSVPVKGYGSHAQGLPEFLAAKKAELDPAKPFFYAQHRIMRGTAGGPFVWGQDDGYSTTALSAYPNCVAFCGHGHIQAADERNVWQGAFTAIETPSLSYSQQHGGRDNGFCLSDADWNKAELHRPVPIAKRIEVGGEHRPYSRHGLVVRVYDDRIDVTRRDFLNDADWGGDWSIPLPLGVEKPYAHEYRAAHDSAPTFPAGAKATAKTVRVKDRCGKERDALEVTFPTCPATASTPRAYDYEVAVELQKSDVTRLVATRRVYSPAICLPEAFDKGPCTCLIPAEEVPSNHDAIRVYVTPLNSFGTRGKPLAIAPARYAWTTGK